MNGDMIADCLTKAHDVAAWIEHEAHDLPIHGSLRGRVAGTCFLIAQEHHQGQLVLLDRPAPLHAPAFALSRSGYETYVRGVWVAHCATDEQIEKFARGKEPPAQPDMLAAIKVVEGFESDALTTIRTRNWRVLGDYTHTGPQQFWGWISGDTIEQRYTPDEVIQHLNFTTSIALLSAVGLAAVAGDAALAERVLAKSTEFAR